jgi:YHS domain-containing protein
MPIIIRTIISTLLVFLIASFTAISASAENGIQPGGPVTLGGFSPVSYFKQGKPERGKSRFQSTYQGDTYWFTNEKQKSLFEAQPEKFAPVFPNHCPYNLAMGRSEPIDPTNFKIVDGQLLLFHRSAQNDGLRQWNQTVRSGAITERELIRRAKSNLLDIRF